MSTQNDPDQNPSLTLTLTGGFLLTKNGDKTIPVPYIQDGENILVMAQRKYLNTRGIYEFQFTLYTFPIAALPDNKAYTISLEKVPESPASQRTMYGLLQQRDMFRRLQQTSDAPQKTALANCIHKMSGHIAPPAKKELLVAAPVQRQASLSLKQRIGMTLMAIGKSLFGTPAPAPAPAT